MGRLGVVVVLLVTWTLCVDAAGISFRNQPDTVSAYAGETIYLRCDLNIDPGTDAADVRVTWIKSDSRNRIKYISSHGTIIHAYADPARYSIAGNPALGEHDLMIRDLQYEDSGMFWCQVTAPGQRIESITGRLTVQVPIPVPTCSMSPATPRVGQRVTFTCEQVMHPSVDYDVLNWWNETSRSRIGRQGRYSDGSIYFTRLLQDSDENQVFVCSQGMTFVEGQRNCSIVPLPGAQVSTLANPVDTVLVNPEVKYVSDGGSATFSCHSDAGPVTRWVYGFGNRAAKIRDTKGRFLVSADRSELTVIRTTLSDNGTAVRCIVMSSSEEKLIGRSTLMVLPSETETSSANSRIPLPPRPAATLRPTEPKFVTTAASQRPSTDHRDSSAPNIPGTNLIDTNVESQPNLSGGETLANVHTTMRTTTKATTTAEESTTRRDVVQIGANTDIDVGVEATDSNIDHNRADTPMIETGGGYRATKTNPHEVSHQEKGSQRNNSSGIVGAVIGSLLIIVLILLLVFLIKTKRYPKSAPTWIPPHIVAALKKPIDLVKKSGSEGGGEGKVEKPGKDKASVRMREIEVVVNPPPPEWQFRLKDVELKAGRPQPEGLDVSPKESHLHDGPVYANITPDLSVSHNVHNGDLDEDDDDDDSLFSSDFDDDLDLEGEIAAEMAARSVDSGSRAMESVEDKKSKNVEGLVYAQLDLGPDAEKRSTVFIEGEKTQYAHIHVGPSRKK